MRRPSVANDTPTDRRLRVTVSTADDRVTLALALGRRDLASYAAASGLDPLVARRAVERRRQARRRASGCVEAHLR